MKKVKSILGISILSAVVLFSCTKEEIIESNSSGSIETSSSAKISDPYELLKKGDFTLYQELETYRDDYVNFVPGVVDVDAVNSGGNISPLNCYNGSLCYIIVVGTQSSSKDESITHVMMYQENDGTIKRFKGNVSKLEIVESQIISGEFNINEEY
jgi:hypothetical protein